MTGVPRPVFSKEASAGWVSGFDQELEKALWSDSPFWQALRSDAAAKQASVRSQSKAPPGEDESEYDAMMKLLNAQCAPSGPMDMDTICAALSSSSSSSASSSSSSSSSSAHSSSFVDPLHTICRRIISSASATVKSASSEAGAEQSPKPPSSTQSTRNILLFGPPACGKTRASLAVFRALGWKCVTLRVDELQSGIVGGGAERFRAFKDFVQANQPMGVVFDEGESLVQKRSSMDVHCNALANTFTSLLGDPSQGISGLYVLVTVNINENDVDLAMSSRFKYMLIPRPPAIVLWTSIARRSIANPPLSDRELAALAQQYADVDARAMERLCVEAIFNASLNAFTSAYAQLCDLVRVRAALTRPLLCRP